MEVLEFQYGEKSELTEAISETNKSLSRNDGNTFFSMLVTMPNPAFLYVKWRDMKTKQVFEDKVDLKSRLPSAINDYGIIFFLFVSKLFVYLVSPRDDERPPSWPKGPIKYKEHLKQWEIYPNLADLSSIPLRPVSRFAR